MVQLGQRSATFLWQLTSLTSLRLAGSGVSATVLMLARGCMFARAAGP